VRQVHTTRGVLRPRARRDRRFARVAARLAHASGKPRESYAREKLGKNTTKGLSTNSSYSPKCSSHTTALFTFLLARNARA
jgi:hypothetical protein